MINYSIHTLQLQTRISPKEHHSLCSLLQDMNLPIIPSKNKSKDHTDFTNEVFTYTRLPYCGITSVTLLTNKRSLSDGECIVKYYLYININPYNALYQLEHSGADIIAPEEIRSAMNVIQSHLHNMLSSEIINRLSLCRLDFCMNLIFSDQAIADEYIKLLKKGIPKKALTESRHYDTIQRRLIPYKDSLLLKCKYYTFEIYPKYHQMMSRKMHNPDSALGIVRLELRASKAKISQLMEKYDLYFTPQNYIDFLVHAPSICKLEIPHMVSKMVGKRNFYRYNCIVSRIENSDFNDSDRKLMLQVTKYFQSIPSIKICFMIYNLQTWTGLVHRKLNKYHINIFRMLCYNDYIIKHMRGHLLCQQQLPDYSYPMRIKNICSL